MKKFYTVYKITNNLNGCEYIGYHGTDNLDDSYMGSGTAIINAINKHGVENFTKEILHVFDNSKDALEKEAELVTEEYVKRRDTYNIMLGGETPILPSGYKEGVKVIIEGVEYNSLGYGLEQSGYHIHVTTKEYVWNSPSILMIMGDPSVLCEFVDSERQDYAEEWFNTIDERDLKKRKQFSIAAHKRFKGVPQSEEHKRKRGEAMKGRDMYWMDKINKNPEKIRKTAEFHRGRKRTQETCDNISKAVMGKSKGEKNGNFKGWYITPMGKFDRPQDAADANNCKLIAIRKRCIWNNNKKINKNSYVQNPDITDESYIGSTWAEKGWGFEYV